MSRKKRMLILIHLIFACTFLSWLFMKPYVMAVTSHKSQLALYEMVMERETLFQTLSSKQQSSIKQGFESTQRGSTPSFMDALSRLFLFDTPAFALAWIFFLF